MINHVRTLLLNRARDGFAWDFPGEEFVDPSFRPKQLPIHLQRFNQTLFGKSPDRLFTNYRARQLMTMLHSTELVDYVLATDPRVTYWPITDLALFDAAFTAAAVQIGGPESVLYVAGEFLADEGLGQSQQSWRLDTLADDVLQITRQRPKSSTIDVSYSAAHGLTIPITLPGSNLTVRFHTGEVGRSWQVTASGRSQQDIGQLLASLETTLGDQGISQLFPPPLTEPVVTYKRIWDTHPYFVYRFSALLLAAAAQLDRLPQA